MSAGPLRAWPASAAVFGLSLEVDPGIEIPGIPYVGDLGVCDLDASASGRLVSHPPPQPPTRVRLHAQELVRRWSRACTTELAGTQRSDGAEVTLELHRPPVIFCGRGEWGAF